MSNSINSLGQQDHEDWIVLWQGYLDFYNIKLSNEVTAKTWERINNPEVDIYGICARTETEGIVGIAHYLFHPVTWSISDRCYLEDLFVVDTQRGSGIGKALIEAVYQAGEQRNADQVYWLTAEDNASARRLYDKVGQLTPFIKYRN